jgi:hypothetical protein
MKGEWEKLVAAAIDGGEASVREKYLFLGFYSDASMGKSDKK